MRGARSHIAGAHPHQDLSNKRKEVARQLTLKKEKNKRLMTRAAKDLSVPELVKSVGLKVVAQAKAKAKAKAKAAAKAAAEAAVVVAADAADAADGAAGDAADDAAEPR